jgi:hypothetical protein
MAPVVEGKSLGFNHNTVLKGELLIWRTKNQAIRTKVESNSRIQFASNQSKMVPRKLDPKVGFSLPTRLTTSFESWSKMQPS